jgi:hypothetical protein
MNRRESRYRYREQARQPRLVNQELRDRCWTAATSGVELAGHEFIALMLVVDAHARASLAG